MGCRLTVDPLAELMPEWSSYAYTFNNPVNFTDPDGRFPGPPDVITKVTNKRGDNNYVVRDVSMKMTLTVLNSSGADLSNTMFSKSSGIISLENFKGIGQKHNSELGVTNQDVLKDMTIEYKVVNSSEDIGENDHVMILVDNIPDAVGLADKGGRISAVEIETIVNETFDEVAQHELGHNLNLGHGYGLMSDKSFGNTKLNNRQRGEIISGQITPRAGEGTYRDSLESLLYGTPIQEQVEAFINSNNINH